MYYISVCLALCLSDNLKALYQRGRAHCALHREEEARGDFGRLLGLDPKLKPAVRQELRKLGESVRSRRVREKKNYRTAAEERDGRGGKKSESGRGAKPGDGTARREPVASPDDGEGEEAREEKGRGGGGRGPETAGVQREERGLPGGPARPVEDDKASPGLTQTSGAKGTSAGAESPEAGTEPAVEHAPAEKPANDGAGADKGEANEYAGNVAMPAEPANESPEGVQRPDNEGDNGNAVTADGD